MSRKRKYDAAMTEVIQLKVTGAQLDKFKNIPGGLDYLRTCIETWSDGDEAQALEALRKMEKERDDLERRISEVKGRLTKKTSAEDQLIIKTIEEFKRYNVGDDTMANQRSWIMGRVDDSLLLKKVLERIYPDGVPKDGEIGG
jgi:hypothetical protein